MFDLTSKLSFKKAKSYIKDIRESTFYGVSIFLVGNKSDLKFLREVMPEEAEELKKSLKLSDYLEVSCLSKFNVDLLMNTIVKHFYKVFFKVGSKT